MIIFGLLGKVLHAACGVPLLSSASAGSCPFAKRQQRSVLVFPVFYGCVQGCSNNPSKAQCRFRDFIKHDRKYAPLFMQHAVAYLRPTLPVSAATSLAPLFS